MSRITGSSGVNECPYRETVLSSRIFSPQSSMEGDDPAESDEHTSEPGLMGIEATGGEYDVRPHMECGRGT